MSQSESGLHYKLVDSYVVHDRCTRLADRIDEIVPPEAEYVVFDLDRTVHLGVTIGERLGWEIILSRRGRRTDIDERESFWHSRRPIRSSVNLAVGLFDWLLPGLFYAGTVRLGGRWPAWHRRLNLTLGPRYVEHAQALVRSALMATTADLTDEQLEQCAERAWQKWRPNLVVDSEVIAKLRDHCPNLRGVLLSSASTTPTVAHAARSLGMDGYVSSSVEVYDVEDARVYSAPTGLPLWVHARKPRFFSRPGAVLHNAAANKVKLLRMRYPDMFDGSALTVGITDNNHGEDRDWAEHFSQVVALNSAYPFSPFVRSSSPCRAIHVVDAASEHEAGITTNGGPPIQKASKARKAGALEARALQRDELTKQFGGDIQAELNALFADLQKTRAETAEALDTAIRQRSAEKAVEVTELVDAYNRASMAEKKRLGRRVNKAARELSRLGFTRTALDKRRFSLEHEIEALQRSCASALSVRRSVASE